MRCETVTCLLSVPHSIVSVLLAFHLLTLAQRHEAGEQYQTKWWDLFAWLKCRSNFHHSICTELDKYIINLTCFYFARYSVMNAWLLTCIIFRSFHILPQVHSGWHTIHSTKFSMFITLFKMLHEKVMSISLFSELLLCTAIFYVFNLSFPLLISPLHDGHFCISSIAVREAHATVPTVHCLGNGAAVTRHISLIELQSLLLSLYASQTSVCSRSNSTFVTLKLTLRAMGFLFIKPTEHFSNIMVHWLCGNALLKFNNDVNSLLCLYY